MALTKFFSEKVEIKHLYLAAGKNRQKGRCDMNDDKYTEKGFFRRLFEMFQGLRMPRDTREYKLARIELQRLSAPLTAIVVPTLFGIVLCVVTAISSQRTELPPVDIAPIEDDPIDLTPPIFEEVTLRLDPRFCTGRTFRILAAGISHEAEPKCLAKLNGRLLDRSYITTEEVRSGGVLEWIPVSDDLAKAGKQ